MAKRATRELKQDNGSTKPRLGVVIRFPPKSAGAGIRQMESGGLQVASSTDFKSAPSVPNDFDGADVQYFERFGIAIVRREEDSLRPVLEKAVARSVVSSIRPERRYRALGTPAPQVDPRVALDQLSRTSASLDRDYLRGYRDATNHLIDRLLSAEPEAAPMTDLMEALKRSLAARNPANSTPKNARTRKAPARRKTSGRRKAA